MPTPTALPDQSLILFQGDSITDGERQRRGDGGGPELGLSLGGGYAFLCAAQLGSHYPTAGYQVRNLGIAGNRIVDLAARIQEHGWNLKPNVLSILIGVNDTWHGFQRQAGVDIPRFARTYRTLLTDTRARLPATTLMLCEPFVLACGVVGPGWRAEIDQRRAVVAELAQEFRALLVPFQQVFDDACREAPAEHWAADGVHPTAAGHHRMAVAWLKAVGAL